MGRKEEWKYDADYIRYVESGESAAVFVVRDVAGNVPTHGKWVDIVSMSAHRQDEDGWAFNWIIAEIFTRKIQPVYSPNDTDKEKRYITWKTAHKDISQQRITGYSDPKYLVLCNLRDKNKGKIITLNLTAIIKRYTGPNGEIKDIKQECKESESIKEKLPHDWEYKITFLKRLNDEQAKSIEARRAELESGIKKNGSPTPEIFGFKGSAGKKNAQPKQDSAR